MLGGSVCAYVCVAYIVYEFQQICLCVSMSYHSNWTGHRHIHTYAVRCACSNAYRNNMLSIQAAPNTNTRMLLRLYGQFITIHTHLDMQAVIYSSDTSTLTLFDALGIQKLFDSGRLNQQPTHAKRFQLFSDSLFPSKACVILQENVDIIPIHYFCQHCEKAIMILEG